MFLKPTLLLLFSTIVSDVLAEQRTYNQKMAQFQQLVRQVGKTPISRSNLWKLEGPESKETVFVSSYFSDILQSGPELFSSLESGNVSERCISDTMTVMSALRETPKPQWAVQMIDAIGKLPGGLLDGRFTWIGSYDECVDIVPIIYQGPNMTDPVQPFKGQYCKVTVPLPIGQAQNFFFGPVSVLMGVCVPSTCAQHEVVDLINTVLETLPGNFTSDLRVLDALCQKDELEYDAKAIVVLIILGLFICIISLGTLYDIFVIHKLHLDRDLEERKLKSAAHILANGGSHRTEIIMANGENMPLLDKTKMSIQDSPQQGTFGKVLLAFSVYTNGSKLLSTDQSAGTLSAVNGIRFFSMTWVILGHTYFTIINAAGQVAMLNYERQFKYYNPTAYVTSMSFVETVGAVIMVIIGRCNHGYTVARHRASKTYDNFLLFYNAMLKRWTFQAIANATVSVDTFFTLSGLLVAYLSLREMKKIGGALKFNWGLFYFHRFWRLTPPYMLVMMVYVPLFQYWNNGPMWPQTGIEVNYCRDSWWKNLLYINNFFKLDDQCMGWSWYLANDMQFFILSPLMLIPLFYSSLFGGAVCLVFLLATTITPGVLSSIHNWPEGMVGHLTDLKVMTEITENYYYRPYCRMGPYIVGIITGYILYRTNCKCKMNKLTNLAGWAVAGACCMSVVYGPYDNMNGSPASTEVAALYNAVHSSVWAVGVCWVIFACATGNGGIVNGFLSWKPLIPLARLTYCAYLIHLVIMHAYDRSKRNFVYITDLEVIYAFLGHLVVTYIVAFVVSLAFESPFMGLEKAIFKRERKS